MTTTCAERDVAAALSAAHTATQLLAAAQRIQHVVGIDPRERLGVAFKRRYDEFHSRKTRRHDTKGSPCSQ